MEALLATLAGLLGANLFVSVRIYFRLGEHDAHLTDYGRRILNLEGNQHGLANEKG